MPPKKATPTRPARGRSPKKPKEKDEVEELAENLQQSAVVTKSSPPACYSFSYKFPMTWNTAIDGTKEIVYLDFQSVNLPPNFLRMAKVLPGGTRFGLLMGSPRWFYEEGYLMAQLGNNFNENDARVQSRNATVVQPVRRMASGSDRFQVGDMQIVNLPFKCVEGDYAPQWGDWRTGWMMR